MIRIALNEIPHFVLKEATLIEGKKRDLLRESYALFRILLSVCDIINLRFYKKGNSIKIDYYLEGDQKSIAKLLKDIEYFKFKSDATEFACLSEPLNTKLLVKKVQLLPVGDLTSSNSELEIMQLGKFNSNRIFTIPVTRQVSLFINNYKWKNVLFALAEGGGEVLITVNRELPNSFDRQYALQCLSYYIHTYANKLLPEDIHASIGGYQKIITGDELFKTRISISDNNSEFLKLALLRDIDLDAFDFRDNRDKSLDRADEEEKKFIEKLRNFWSLDEVITLLTPPYTFEDALSGITHFVPKPFVLPSLNKDLSKSNSLLLGNIDGKNTFQINSDQLRQHLFVTGASGSGKTHTVHHLLCQLSKQVPILIIDPVKREYENFIPKIDAGAKIIDFLGDRVLRFNPFIPPENIKIYAHSTVLAKSLAILFPTNEVAYELILNMIRQTYIWKLRSLSKTNKVSLKNFLEIDGAYLRNNPNAIPTFDEFLNIGIQWLNNLGKRKVKGKKKSISDDEGNYKSEAKDGQRKSGQDSKWVQEAVQHFERRWEFLKNSLFKYIFSSNESAEKYFKSTYLIELYNILDINESNAIFTLLVSFLYENRLSCGLKDNLQHITVIEEAHRIIPSKQAALGESIISSPSHESAKLIAQMLSEIRAFGEGVIVVDQSPSKILPDVLINSSTKIIHRVLYGVDKEFLGQAMSLTQRETDHLSYLATGDAIAFTTDVYQPIYITVPELS
jgi:Helicase HerA, central domain